jgi:hypothetical protein
VPTLPPLTSRSTAPTRVPVSTPVPAPQAPDADDDAMPHIELGGGGQSADGQGVEWMKWALLLLIAVATAVIAFFLLPSNQ